MLLTGPLDAHRYKQQNIALEEELELKEAIELSRALHESQVVSSKSVKHAHSHSASSVSGSSQRRMFVSDQSTRHAPQAGWVSFEGQDDLTPQARQRIVEPVMDEADRKKAEELQRRLREKEDLVEELRRELMQMREELKVRPPLPRSQWSLALQPDCCFSGLSEWFLL